MTQPKPPGPRQFWLRQYSQDGGMYSDIRVMKPSDCDLGVSPPPGHDNLKYYEEVHVIEYAEVERIEAELREAKAERDFCKSQWEHTAKQVEELQIELNVWFDRYAEAPDLRKQVEELKAEAERDMARIHRQSQLMFEVERERDRYRATSELKLGELELLAKLEQVEELKAEVERLKAQDLTHAVIAADVKLREERDALAAKLKRARAALEVYAMTNETFPEYGDVARQALAEIGED